MYNVNDFAIWIKTAAQISVNIGVENTMVLHFFKYLAVCSGQVSVKMGQVFENIKDKTVAHIGQVKTWGLL